MEMPVCSIPDHEGLSLPASKSLVLRSMALYFVLTRGEIMSLTQECLCGDTLELQAALAQLRKAWRKEIPAAEIHIEAGGAPLRITLALAASLQGVDTRITVGKRLAERPQAPLLESLREIGAGIEERSEVGWLIEGRQLRGGEVRCDFTRSSQYATALMLASPLWQSATTVIKAVDTEGRIVSRPYLKMTASLMTRFGIRVNFPEDGILIDTSDAALPVRDGIAVAECLVETDWSAAAFFRGMEAIARKRGLTVYPWRPRGLLPFGKSLQGDARAEILFDSLETCDGVFEADMEDVPDLVPPLVATALLTGRPFRLTGVRNLRYKESDRLTALRNEFGRLGFLLRTDLDCIAWDGDHARLQDKSEKNPVPCRSYGDHRIAMALSMAIFAGRHIELDSPETVEKSFPGYWKEFEIFYKYSVENKE